MRTPTSLLAAAKTWNIATVLSVLALIVSAASLYYSRQSELRQLEQLIIAASEELSLDMTSPAYVITKPFLVTNISERVISIQKFDLDIKRPTDGRDSSPVSIKIGDREIFHNDELNLVVKPGESLSVTASFSPSIGRKAANFLSQQKVGDNGAKIAALCKQIGIDYYDNELNDVQRSECPSFRDYKGKNNLQFSLPGGGRGDVLMLVVRTYRENAFASDRFKVEIGNSKL